MSPGQDGLGPLTVSTVISESIARRPEFADDYIELNKVELSRNAQEPLDELRIKRLLESSAIFSLSRDDKHRKIAYKIGIFLLRQQAAQYDTIPFVVQLVLARLGDLPSIQHMVKSEQFADYFHYFTPEDAESSQMLERWYLQFPEVLGKKIYNQATFGNATLSFTDFQSTILGSLQGRRDVVFSAPTSAGKSFLIMNYIGQQLATTTRFCAVYIVPTKALMAEVQASTSDSAKRMGLTAPEFVVLSSPSVLNIAEIQDIPKKVLVLTQERLQEMLANRMDIKVDLLILDEAQKIEDADRGIVIEDAVRELIEHNPSMQKVVISPYVRNLAKFSQIFDVPKDRLVTSTTSRSPVGQAVLFVKFSKKKEGRGTNVLISTYLPEIEKTVQLEALTTLKGLPIPSYARKAWVAKYVVTGDDPTLIYCNRPSDSRNVGRQLVAYGTGGGDEAEEAWRIVMPVLQAWGEGRVRLEEYPAGSTGPPASPDRHPDAGR